MPIGVRSKTDSPGKEGIKERGAAGGATERHGPSSGRAGAWGFKSGVRTLKIKGVERGTRIVAKARLCI
jgi:hypothetical protein